MQIVGFRVKTVRGEPVVYSYDLDQGDINKLAGKLAARCMIMGIPFILPQSALAAGAAPTVRQALAPLVQMVKDVAEPAAYMGGLYGCIQISLGKQYNGMKTIKQAAMGYVGVQWMPWLMAIIRSVGEAGVA